MPAVNRLPSGRRAGALGALALAGALLATTPAAQAAPAAPSTGPAAATSPTALPTPTGDGARTICKRLPSTEGHLTNALNRLNGSATVAGSVARLEQRVANAKAAGHTEVETYLNGRLTARKALVGTLKSRQDDLKSVATWCAAHGKGAGK
ncbi:hypothetical protein SAMN05216371_7090 [Streptomyces sp. TLI_053]|uniref:hypothetical protein n=1 Tax=Streptomyces sp. TLI_053 TaxID=1855352 RepID=UPI00087B9302|nr:hypothetical protein [Streptomyces sp. TLI_053]SDT82306.1 hypothetical protein SAMN05216371_7090 [Streptomyces sp. TLI_053]